MANRCLNKVMLIGNLTRDPELRYTPAGVAVCTFGVATNRQWTTQSGEQKEDAQFHRIVAWNRLAELCSQLLTKGRRVYVEGRLQHREFTGNDNLKRQVTEIVIDDMVILDSRKAPGEENLEAELEKTATYGKGTATPPAEVEIDEVSSSLSEPASLSSQPAPETQEKATKRGRKKAVKEEMPF